MSQNYGGFRYDPAEVARIRETEPGYHPIPLVGFCNHRIAMLEACPDCEANIRARDAEEAAQKKPEPPAEQPAIRDGQPVMRSTTCPNCQTAGPLTCIGLDEKASQIQVRCTQCPTEFWVHVTG